MSRSKRSSDMWSWKRVPFILFLAGMAFGAWTVLGGMMPGDGTWHWSPQNHIKCADADLVCAEFKSFSDPTEDVLCCIPSTIADGETGSRTSCAFPIDSSKAPRDDVP